MSYAKKDFEKGVPFKHKTGLLTYIPMYSDYGASLSIKTSSGEKRYYCSVTLGEESFLAWTSGFFGKKVEAEVLYTDLIPASL